MLGSDLVRDLSPKFRITGITRENYDTFKGLAFDVIINANGNSKRFWANEHPFEDFNTSTISVYKSMFDFRCRIYIYISSPDVYDKHESPRFTSEIRKVNPVQLSSYGLHKYLSEIIVQKHAQNYLVLRCSMILGTKIRKGPIFDILHGNPLYISRNSRLQMITTEEIVRVILLFLNKDVSCDTFNVGGTGTVSFHNLQTILERPVTFSADAKRQTYEMAVGKLKKIYPLKTSEEYLQQFIDSL